VLIRGEGFDGVSFDLTGQRHLAGRSIGELLFPDDGYLSARHAEFFFENGALHVADQGSLNGVYRRISTPIELGDGDLFLAGEELLQVQLTPLDTGTQAKDGTHFFASPMPTVHWRVRQILEGGRPGRCTVSPGSLLTIGREGCHLNFPQDRFISGQHCQIEFSAQSALLTDLGSRNGSFVRVDGVDVLADGDHLFLGRQLLRVEMLGGSA
jgi:pSer/pThr/pTyr-binding forkhead associated (FHA) protein